MRAIGGAALSLAGCLVAGTVYGQATLNGFGLPQAPPPVRANPRPRPKVRPVVHPVPSVAATVPPAPVRRTLPMTPIAIDADTVRVVEASDAFQKWPRYSGPHSKVSARRTFTAGDGSITDYTIDATPSDSGTVVFFSDSVNRILGSTTLALGTVRSESDTGLCIFGGLLLLGSQGADAQAACDGVQACATLAAPSTSAGAHQISTVVHVTHIDGSLFPFRKGVTLSFIFDETTSPTLTMGTTVPGYTHSYTFQCIAGDVVSANLIDGSFTGNADRVHCARTIDTHDQTGPQASAWDDVFIEELGLMGSMIGGFAGELPYPGLVLNGSTYRSFALTH
jgi:hypothetical protein